MSVCGKGAGSSPFQLPALEVGHAFLGNQGFLLLGTEDKAPLLCQATARGGSGEQQLFDLMRVVNIETQSQRTPSHVSIVRPAGAVVHSAASECLLGR